ncbi:MAG: hypothetical protein O3A65_03970 [Proteobacteria bacterium]|nr:hypothetical protein [Pseudomonadota bacterium]
MLVSKSEQLKVSGIAFLISLVILSNQAALSQDNDLVVANEPPFIPEMSFESERGAESKDWSSPLNKLGVTGSLRGGYWSSNRLNNNDKDLITSSVWFTLEKHLTHGLKLYTDGYVYNKDSLGIESSDDRVKEIYLHFRTGNWDYRLGRQIIAWGRADRINPTDNLTPRDFTLLSPEADEERMGTEAVKISKVFGLQSSLTAIWLINFEPNKLPPANTSGLQFVDSTPTNHQQYALKFDQSGGNIDWSISYFSGIDLNTDLTFTGTSGADILVSKKYNEVNIIGADLATVVGSNRYAIEAAHTQTKDTSGVDASIKNSFTHIVVGVERDFGKNLSAIGQGFYRRVYDYQDPREIADESRRKVASLSALTNHQLDKDEYGMSIRVGKKWLNDTLEVEFAASTLFKRHGYAVRPKMTYSINDHFKATTGLEYFDGAADTIFSLQNKNKTIFSELRYFF